MHIHIGELESALVNDLRFSKYMDTLINGTEGVFICILESYFTIHLLGSYRSKRNMTKELVGGYCSTNNFIHSNYKEYKG
jgi:hypothetical protein